MSCALPLVYRVRHGSVGNIEAQAAWAELEPFSGGVDDPIRTIERASIRWWMESQRAYLTGRVLDFGAGKPGTCREPQPYRDLVAGEYVPYDLGDQLPGRWFDAVMCNQVLQYVDYPRQIVGLLSSMLYGGGHLVMTFATNWAESEDTDKWRFTEPGMRALLRDLFEVVAIDRRAEVRIGSFSFPLGYGVVARKV